MLKKLDIPKGTICLCAHCGERFGSSNGRCALYCKNCRTAEQRNKITKENENLYEENKNLLAQKVFRAG